MISSEFVFLNKNKESKMALQNLTLLNEVKSKYKQIQQHIN